MHQRMVSQKVILDLNSSSDTLKMLKRVLRDDRFEVSMIIAAPGIESQARTIVRILKAVEDEGTYAPPVFKGVEKLMASLQTERAARKSAEAAAYALPHTRLGYQKENGITEILRALEESEEGTVDLVITSPMTNLAVALLINKKAVMRLRRIYALGIGGLYADRRTSLDPEAMNYVLEAGFPKLVFVDLGNAVNPADILFEEDKETCFVPASCTVDLESGDNYGRIDFSKNDSPNCYLLKYAAS